MKSIKFKQIYLLVATLGLSILTFTSVSAWGPERATFTMENPATYPTFNSITNNPTIGDERDFVRVGEINADVTQLKNEVEVVPGRQYVVYIYYHNNASSTYNDKAHNYAGVAVNTRLATSFSTVLTPSEKGTITGTISADNANPAAVWDEAYMTTKANKVLMHYVAGSAKIYNDWGANNTVMPSNLFTKEGVLLGLNALNGLVPGCEEYHGVVSYVLQAEELGGSIDKVVSRDDGSFSESAILAPGEESTFQLTIVNTGDVALTNAIIKDSLPNGMSLIPGSVKLRANDSAAWDQLSDDIINNGINLGTIGTGNTVYVQYKVKISDEFDCSSVELKNNATLVYDSNVSSGDMREDSAIIIVKKDGCETPPPDCETDPTTEGCTPPSPETPEDPGTPDELPNTGPLEIIMAILVVAGICGGGYYFYRSRKNLNKVEKKAKGKKSPKEQSEAELKPEGENIAETTEPKPTDEIKK